MKSVRIIALLFAALAFTTVASAQEKFDGTFGWNYSHSSIGGASPNLNGWMLKFGYWTSDNLAYVVDVDNYYGKYQGQSANRHNFMFGPQYTFGSSDTQNFRPLVYAQAGLERASAFGDVNHGISLQAGAGASYKLRDRVYLQFIPLEYNVSRVGGSTLNSYDAKFGVTFTLWGND
jgi:hypothetical protein